MPSLCNRCNAQHGVGVCPYCGCPEFRLGPDEDGDDEPGCDIDEVEPEDNPLLKKGKRKPPPRRKKRG
jgi:hypothetical protein